MIGRCRGSFSALVARGSGCTHRPAAAGWRGRASSRPSLREPDRGLRGQDRIRRCRVRLRSSCAPFFESSLLAGRGAFAGARPQPSLRAAPPDLEPSGQRGVAGSTRPSLRVPDRRQADYADRQSVAGDHSWPLLRDPLRHPDRGRPGDVARLRPGLRWAITKDIYGFAHDDDIAGSVSALICAMLGRLQSGTGAFGVLPIPRCAWREARSMGVQVVGVARVRPRPSLRGDRHPGDRCTLAGRCQALAAALVARTAVSPGPRCVRPVLPGSSPALVVRSTGRLSPDPAGPAVGRVRSRPSLRGHVAVDHEPNQESVLPGFARSPLRDVVADPIRRRLDAVLPGLSRPSLREVWHPAPGGPRARRCRGLSPVNGHRCAKAWPTAIA